MCKEFFRKTIDENNKRVSNVSNKKEGNSNSVAHTDKRGHKVPGKTISDQATEIIKITLSLFLNTVAITLGLGPLM